MESNPLPGDPKGMSEDAQHIRRSEPVLSRRCSTSQPTAFYNLNPRDVMHQTRLQLMGTAYDATEIARCGAVRAVDKYRSEAPGSLQTREGCAQCILIYAR